MAIVITPWQLTSRAELYHQLGQLLAAGLPIVRALEQLERHPPSHSFRAPLRHLIDELARGFTFAEAAQRAATWASPFDLALLDAGERSGRLDACFRVLADHYTDRARMARQMISSFLYPVGLLHFAVFILPFAAFFTGQITLPRYLAQTFGVLIPIYVIVALLIFSMQGSHGKAWRALVERLLRPIPIIGSARRDLSLARLSLALEALISAGVTVVEAWDLAVSVSGSPALGRAVRAWRADVQNGVTPSEAINASGEFPALFANQYATGEVSGKLDEVLRRLHTYYREEGTRKLEALAQWTPRVAYLMVALMIAYRVISFYTAYFQQIQNISGGF